MKIAVKNDAVQEHTTDDTRELYKALGKGHLHDYEMRDAKQAAQRWRAVTSAKGKKPGGWGFPMLTLPGPIVDHYREARKEMYQADRNKFWCWLWHRFADFRCSNDTRCPECGRG